MKKTLLQLFIIFMLISLSAKSQTCPKIGDATDAKRQATNTNKNRDKVPVETDIDLSVTIFKMLNSQDNANAFDENKAATITGYLFKAKDEGPESCNCHSTNKADHDIHIFIAPSKSVTSIGECVIVEITPWIKKMHPDWTSEYLNSIAGHHVSVTGWLLYDWEHVQQSVASHPDLEKPARGCVWELHPITNITDLEGDSDEEPTKKIVASTPQSTETPSTSANISTANTTQLGTLATNDPVKYLALLLIAALLGGLGQFIRILPKFKKLQTSKLDNTGKQQIGDIHNVLTDNLRYMLFTILIAMVIGALAGIVGMLVSKDFTIDSTHIMMLIASGYAGTDLIESLIIKK